MRWGGAPLMACDSHCFCLTGPFTQICQGPGLEASTDHFNSTCSGCSCPGYQTLG